MKPVGHISLGVWCPVKETHASFKVSKIYRVICEQCGHDFTGEVRELRDFLNSFLGEDKNEKKTN